MLVLGIDEAGRGPVIGPMVIAGVLDTDKSEKSYKEAGCRDSKLVAPKRRKVLDKLIRNSAKDVKIEVISAQEIDKLRKVMSLNEVEAKFMADIIQGVRPKPDKVIVDCPDTQPERLLRRLAKYLDDKYEIVAEHKADVTYPIVSAASIVAKVERDKRIEKLYKKYGDFGSGYPADPKTKAFLDAYFKKYGKVPAEARKSWETSKRLVNAKFQTTL